MDQLSDRILRDIVKGASLSPRRARVQFDPPDAEVKVAFVQGARDALSRFAMNPETAHHIAELAGLGLIAGEPAYQLLRDPAKKETDPHWVHNALVGADLAGLGILAAPSITHLMSGH